MRKVGILFFVIMAWIYISWYFDENKVGVYGPEKGFTMPVDNETKPYPIMTPSIQGTDTTENKIKPVTKKSK